MHEVVATTSFPRGVHKPLVVCTIKRHIDETLSGYTGLPVQNIYVYTSQTVKVYDPLDLEGDKCKEPATLAAPAGCAHTHRLPFWSHVSHIMRTWCTQRTHGTRCQNSLEHL